MATQNKKIYSGQLSQFDQNFFAYSSGLLSLFFLCLVHFGRTSKRKKHLHSFASRKTEKLEISLMKRRRKWASKQEKKTKQNKQYWNTKYGSSVTNLYHFDRAKYFCCFCLIHFLIAASEFDSKTNEQQSNWNWTKQLMNWI